MSINKILITGKSGFLGKQIYNYLTSRFSVTSLGRSEDDSFKFNLTDKTIKINEQFDLVIHCGGKAHSSPKTALEKQEFFDINVTGTQNLLRGLERSPSIPKSFVFISSVAVYGLDKGENIKEDHPLNAKDPYGLSKIQAEEIIRKWCEKNNVICTILRLSLLVGKNPPGNLGAMIKGIQKGYYMNIGGGLARKSMVMAEDVAKFILQASEVGGIYNLTDGYHPNFKELSEHIALQLRKKKPYSLPYFIAKGLAKTGDFIGTKFPFNSYKLSKIQADLTFNDSKAREAFGWKPENVLDAFKLNA
jgi:nucleoside-diphosphate-sugar epimerase